ncbi:hypothetical protein [Lonsdalea iberica]|uniref:hypothetical protein n=1 Tax=Lonsdalea iberica TaxID=1082703 RepID=UPI00111C85BF|nr:hypothetical protein [Lonsdalea iberica]
MGQSVVAVPVPAGLRCVSSDYGAAAASTFYDRASASIDGGNLSSSKSNYTVSHRLPMSNRFTTSLTRISIAGNGGMRHVA